MHSSKGFTLIELMVALLLASLLMLTMLTLFKQISFIGMSTAEDAEYEAQMEIGLLTISRLVTNAGYGMGQDDDIVIGQYEGKRAVFWRYAQDHQVTPIVKECRGFGVKIEGSGSEFKHRLLFLKAPCTQTDLIDETWSVVQPIATVKSEQSTSPAFGFSLIGGACVPFGIDQGSVKGNKRLVIEGTRKNNFGVGNKTRQICFNNIKAP